MLVSTSLHNSPHTRQEISRVLPLICATVGHGDLSPGGVRDAIAPGDISPLTLGMVNGILLVYEGWFYSQPATNQAAIQPYANAILCQGPMAGLGVYATPKPLALTGRQIKAAKRGQVVLPALPGPSQWPLIGTVPKE